MQKRDHFKRLQRKQYTTGVYRNPYFKDRKKLPVSKIIGGGVIFFIACVSFIFLYSYSGFALKDVSITGLNPNAQSEFQKQSNEYLQSSHLFFFHSTNRFLFSEKKLQETLSKSFSFDSIHIRVSHNTIFVDVKERASQFTWKTGSDTFLVDLSGTLMQKIESSQIPPQLVQPSKIQPLPVFIDRNNTVVNVGDHVLSSSEITNIFLFVHRLAEQSISTKEIQIDQLAGKWRGVLTNQGYTILFDPSTDVTTQAEKLKTLLQNTLKDTSHLQYIDLRFGDHVYYK